ncbi:MAG TPA: hypothetical protein VF056_06415 [Thermoleophilaceae bacterium]
MPADAPAPLRAAFAVGLVAGCTLALQVLLTRVLSAVLAYHFSFLAISLALLGVGAGALAVYLRGSWFEGPLEGLLARWAAVLAASLALVPLALVRLDYSSGIGASLSADFVVNLALVCVLAAIPFLAAGVAIALAVRGFARWIGRIYAFDLGGAALGALGVVPLLWIVSGTTLLVGLSLVAAAAALLFAAGARREKGASGYEDAAAGRLAAGRLAAGAAVLAAVATLLAATTDLYELPPHTTAAEGEQPLSVRWTPLTRVLAYPPPGDARIAPLFYDRIYAPVAVRRPGDPIPDWRQLSLGPQSVGYELTGPGTTLVIGGGGGRDIENALSSGQERVDVIELNRAIRDAVDQDLRRWSGAPYSLPGVSVDIGDGRSRLAARDTQYDVIHIGFTDTLSANSAAGFALTEANLYTLEAYEEYFDHLKPGGILNVTRLHRLVGDEALRATVLALEALKREGVEHPERNVVVLLGHDIFNELFGTVLARRDAWTAAELAFIRRIARERGDGVAFAPGGPYRLEWADLASAPDHESFCRDYRLDVCPPTDERPFFFNMTRLSGLFDKPPAGYFFATDPLRILAVTVVILAVLCALAFGLPLGLMPRGARPPASSVVFFGAIGVGFLLLEIALIQRFVLFLGFPTYALSVVLFALLAFTGIGSLISGRLREPRRGLIVALACGGVLIAAAAPGLQPLLRSLIEWPFEARVALTVVLLAPAGLALGMAMPIGLTRLAGLHPGAVPWAWAVNGIASVLASVLAVAVAITWGFAVVTLLALACYLVALVDAVRGPWPAS